MSKKLEQILSVIPSEKGINKSVAILIKKMMEGMCQIAEEDPENVKNLSPSDAINIITLAGVALVSDLASTAVKEDSSEYVLINEYAKSAIDSAFLMLSNDFLSFIADIEKSEEKLVKPYEKEFDKDFNL